MQNRYLLWLGLLFFLLVPTSPERMDAKDYTVPEYGYYISLPESWEVLDAAQPQLISFTDSDHVAVFQIKTFDGSAFQNPKQMCEQMKTALKAQGDVSGFPYNGRDAVLADFTFDAGGYVARGYFVFINGSEYDTVLIGFTGKQYYDRFQQLLLSCIDSFSGSRETRLQPGPISQFYYPVPGDALSPVSIPVLGTSQRIRLDRNTIEASQVVIEREAKVLGKYKQDRDEAWSRYYRMIYRDNYARLEPIFRAVERVVEQQGLSREEIPRKLLSWIQSFTYTRTNSLSDLLSPVATAVEQTGDCDSRGLLYASILHHLGIDAILLVSSKYKHSVVGVDTPGKGARYPFEGTQYLIAETSDQVSIGLIPQEMSAREGWLAIRLLKSHPQ